MGCLYFAELDGAGIVFGAPVAMSCSSVEMFSARDACSRAVHIKDLGLIEWLSAS